MAKVFESMKEATGIDLADIINAESYDAKVNRNVNLSGLDSVNFVVKDDGTNVTMGKPQTKVNATAVEASAQGTGTASETTNQQKKNIICSGVLIFIDNAHKQGNDRTCTVVFLIF